MYLLAATTTDLGPVVGGEVAGADTGEAMETAEGGGRGGACCCGCGHTDRQTDRQTDSFYVYYPVLKPLTMGGV